jgi:hypothetical protein
MTSTLRRLSKITLVSLLGLIATSCYQAPEFANEPEISFNNIVFSKGSGELEPDSLILTINFKDGDGDLGLRSEGADTREPYNDLWYFIKEDGTFVTLADRGTPGFEALPPYEFPFYCTDYLISENDTFYIEKNEFHHNIDVKFFVKKNGQYTEFDFQTAFDPICGESFDGRFPLLNSLDRERPLEGKLKYKMESVGFEFIFRLDTVMLEVFIYDRALNKSNVIQTPDFVLRDITVGG